MRHSNFYRRAWLPALTAVGLPGVHLLSRPGARFQCYHRPVSPDRSPNPPCELSPQRALPGFCRQAGFAGGHGAGILFPR
jgi:hypothetical protein